MLSLFTPAQSLTEDHFPEVNPLLKRLSKDELVLVGTALGLLYTNCKDMSKTDIVSAWLRGNDNVLTASDGGDSRTWDALIAALKSNGYSGVADNVQKVAIINKAILPMSSYNIIFIIIM